MFLLLVFLLLVFLLLVFLLLMRTYLLYFFACLRLSDIHVKPIKKEERHHYSCAKVVFLFQKTPNKAKKTLITPNLIQNASPPYPRHLAQLQGDRQLESGSHRGRIHKTYV